MIASADADIVCLNECNHWSDDGWRALCRVAGQLGLCGLVARANSPYHQAILTRWSIEQFANHADGLTHGFGTAVIRRPGGPPVRVFAAHLNPHDEDRRLAEIELLLAAMEPYRDELTVLAGDLNSYVADDLYRGHRVDEAHLRHPKVTVPIRCEVQPRLRAAGWSDAYRALHPTEPGYTFRADEPYCRIDYCYLSPPLRRRLIACDVWPHPRAAEASDHLPLIAEFDLWEPA